jgi:hypothetical protein
VTRKVRDIKSALLKKGFQEESESHHVYFWFYYEGKRSAIKTYVSHGATDIGAPLIGMMGKQTKLNKEGFLRLVDCTMDEDSYKNILIEKGEIQPSPELHRAAGSGGITPTDANETRDP